MPGESVVTQVQLTEDGSRPVDLPEQFKDVTAMAEAFKEAQATITRLSQPKQEIEPPAPIKAKKADDGLTPEMRSAMENISNFNEAQRKLRFESQVGTEGLAALDGFLSGEAIAPELKASYEAALETGKEALIDANFNMIRLAFEDVNGSFAPAENVVSGIAGAGVTVPSGTVAFRSLEEQLTAQRDPQYNSDPAFRKDVENRIAISPTYQV